MNASILKFAFLGLLAIGLNAAEPKEEVKAAAAKLSSAGGYSWTATTTVPEGGQGRNFRAGPTNGKVDKDGLMHVTSTRGENTTEVVGKGEKFAVKTDNGWKTPEELEADSGGDNRGRFRGMAARNTRPPAADVERLLAGVKSLTKEGDAYAGELTEQGAKDLASFGRRGGGGGQAPEISGAKGNVKFWVKDGVLSKYEYSVKGSMSFNGNDMNIDRTTTVEIKEVGKTTLSVPDDAKKKVS